jgi:hypothetical protein
MALGKSISSMTNDHYQLFFYFRIFLYVNENLELNNDVIT